MLRGRGSFAWALGSATVLLLLLAAFHRTTQAQQQNTLAQQQATQRALRWLASQQLPDGSFGGGNSAFALGVGADVVLAAAAGERDPSLFGSTGRPSVLQRLITQTQTFTGALTGGTLGKLALAAVAGDVDPQNFGGRNLPLLLTAAISPTNGSYSLSPFEHAIAMLGVAAVSETVPTTATSFLLSQQLPSGAWSDGYVPGDSVDTTALAIQALIAAGQSPTSTAVTNAVNYVRARQNADAGWGVSEGTPETNVNSTAFVIQALSALREDTSAITGTWAKSGTTPISALLALQLPNGALPFFGQADAFATRQGIPGLAGKPFPIIGRREALRRSIIWLKSRQLANGTFDEFGGGGAFSSPANGSARAIRAIRASGLNPQASLWNGISGTNVVSAFESLVPAYVAAGRGGRVGNVMRGVVAAGAPYTVTNFGGLNLVVSMTGFLSPDGRLDSSAFGQGLAVLGLRQAGFTVPQSATDWLTGTAVITGGADTAGVALQAMSALGLPRSTEAVSRAINLLLTTQLPDGGWGAFSGATSSSPNSTSEAVRGLLAYGVDVRQLQQAQGGRIASPVRFLLDAQSRDGSLPGFFGPDEFAVTDAIYAYTTPYVATTFPTPIIDQRLPLITR